MSDSRIPSPGRNTFPSSPSATPFCTVAASSFDRPPLSTPSLPPHLRNAFLHPNCLRTSSEFVDRFSMILQVLGPRLPPPAPASSASLPASPAPPQPATEQHEEQQSYCQKRPRSDDTPARPFNKRVRTPATSSPLAASTRSTPMAASFVLVFFYTHGHILI